MNNFFHIYSRNLNLRTNVCVLGIARMKYYITGHRGMVGGSLLRYAEANAVGEVLTTTRSELDLTKQELVYQYLSDEKPDVVIVAAAKVGGIMANDTYPADFMRV